MLLRDFSFLSIRFESVIIYRIDNGLVLPDPFLLTTGIYDADPWLSLPYGIEVEYLLVEERSTGGRPYVFIYTF